MRQATLERQQMDAFARYWEDLFEEFPEARRQAVERMGETVQKDLNARIQISDLNHAAKGTVKSWQEVRLGSRGGYAAIAPKKGTASPRVGQKQHTWKDRPITQKQVTRWLERGHGTPSTGKKVWSYNKRTKTLHRVHERRGTGYVKGRLFYSWTRMKAWEHARDAANDLLESIADGE